MKRYLTRAIIISMLAVGWTGLALADWKADVGYTALQNELGANLPTGAGVKVTQVEAGGDEGGGKPDPGNSQFIGKIFIEKTLSLTNDGHATTVGQLFYGNTGSMTPGITQIDCYASGNWRSSFLRYSTYALPISSSRVGNHSYVGAEYGTTGTNRLARMDWVVNRDEFIQATAMNNGSYSFSYFYMGSSFNAISVGLSNGNSAHGAYPMTTDPTTPYASAARTKPDIVVPQSATSWAAPTIASAAALLVDAGHRTPSLSDDPTAQSTTNRNGDTIYNAERSETVKAALMAGASRTSPNLGTRYSINTDNGLNGILGAGELNIQNSYHILAGGEQNSQEDKPSTNGNINKYGFDYDPQFGGSSSSNRTGTYVFHANSEGTLSASLVWNLNIAGGPDGSFDTTATLYNLNLNLYDTTTSAEVASYSSTVDNTQNISTVLTPNHDYRLEVKAQTPENFNWDYALAWRSTAEFNGSDTNPPMRTNGNPSGTLATNTTQTTLSLKTDENATCKYSTSPNTAYGSMASPFTTADGTIHSATVTNLANGQTYNYYVRCQDSSNNPNTNDYTISFLVANPEPFPTYSNADMNQDTKINFTDFSILKADFLRLTANLSNSRSDIDSDGQATIKDVGILMSGWR
jgi:hypothetical protein